MTSQINQFISKFKDHNFKVLWAESAVLSVIIGAGLGSWPGVIILLAGLTWVLHRRWGAIYLIGIFSCAWGFMAGMIGFGLGGWAWALLLGILSLISGVKIHLRDLKKPFNHIVIGQNNTNEWKQCLNWGRQNLN
jgi:hypothetical protein